MNKYLSPLESKMQADYDIIAQAFASSTRAIKWPELRDLIGAQKPKAMVLDIGCGAGRFCSPIVEDGLSYIGIDISQGQIDQAKKACKQGQFIQGSMLNLPFEDSQFDVVVFIASLHHLENPDKRLQALKEAKRVLKKDGVILITVMNFWRKKFRRLLFSKKNAKDSVSAEIYNALKWNDVLWPWTWKSKVPVYRYYHAFRKAELASLIKESGLTLEVINYRSEKNKAPWYKGKNLVAVARKR